MEDEEGDDVEVIDNNNNLAKGEVVEDRDPEAVEKLGEYVYLYKSGPLTDGVCRAPHKPLGCTGVRIFLANSKDSQDWQESSTLRPCIQVCLTRMQEEHSSLSGHT